MSVVKKSELLEGLNAEQLKAVKHDQGPLLIVAGAGTGKTTVITRRIAYLLEKKKVQPSEILALTFTDKASGEMSERVDQLLPLGGHFDLQISTFHSFCEEVLEKYGTHIGLPYEFKLFDEIQQWILIKNNFHKFELDYYKPAGNPNKFINALVTHFSRCKDETITPKEYLSYADGLKRSADKSEDELLEIKRIQEVAKAYNVYQNLLRENEGLDFGDLINCTLELIVKRPNILTLMRDQYKYIMVDEFQDTNYAQYQLVKYLSGYGQNSDRPQNLVVVGDDDQSIYKFRGASVSNILKFQEDFEDVLQITLTKNYRNTQEILDLAYNFIQANNPNRLENKLGIDKRLFSQTQEKGLIQVLEASDLSSEIDLIIKTIIKNKTDNPSSSWNDFAILIRANSSADEILPKLDSEGITYTFLANRGLYKKKMIADILAYLKLLDNYHESDALYRILQFEKFRVDKNDLSTIIYERQKKARSLYDTLVELREIAGLSEETYSKVETLLELISEHTKLMSQGTAVELFIDIINALDIPKQLTQSETWENAQNLELLDQFYKRIEKFENEADDKSLRAFLSELDLEIQAGGEGKINFDSEQGPESLKIMTIHSAKGLEFKYVFVINMVDQRFPSRSRRDTIELPTALIKDILPEGDFHLQEERRLFYVALTRAKTHLYTSWAKDYGGSREKKVSLFLQESNLVPSKKINKATGKVVLKPKQSKSKRPDKQVYKRIPDTFSYTDVMLFKKCPLEYRERYLKIPTKGTAYLSFGKTIHSTIQKLSEEYNFNRENLTRGSTPKQLKTQSKAIVPNISRLWEIYEKEWLDEWYADEVSKNQFKKDGVEALTVFYNSLKENLPDIRYIEHRFKLHIGGYNFVGAIDRVDCMENGKFWIIDYKTGKTQRNDKDGIDQLRIYQWAMENSFNQQADKLSYWYLRENKFVDVKIATPDQLLALQEGILETITSIVKAIKYDQFEKLHNSANKNHFCKYENLI